MVQVGVVPVGDDAGGVGAGRVGTGGGESRT